MKANHSTLIRTRVGHGQTGLIWRHVYGGASRIVAIVFAALLFVAPALAQTEAPAPDVMPEVMPEQWQASVTGQVEAFRIGQDDLALGYAAASFRMTYHDASDFTAAIRNGGYAPIMDSRSHVFGNYRQVSPEQVLQEVTFFTPGEPAFQALYQLGLEPNGWRVQGVLLRRAEEAAGA